ncbi:hypothetical protein PUN28_020200 [Cardiocondyla obscurior]|uniref:K Homology domain-containing protein n=1 Tax=Cardiocondyla obscurior TaxID=286306 RepID=A0AAW2E8D1_9HYME
MPERLQTSFDIGGAIGITFRNWFKRHVIRSDPLIKRWLKFLKKVSCLMAAFRKGHIKVLKWIDGKKSYNNQYDGDTLNTSSKTSNTSPKQSGKREEGWKEVVRMGQSDDSGRFMNSRFRSKKVSVPTNAISRVIGRGGSHINAIRGATGLLAKTRLLEQQQKTIEKIKAEEK